MPLTAHGEQSALRSHRTPNTAASTASHPAFVTIAIRPYVWDETAAVIEVIWVGAEHKIFCYGLDSPDHTRSGRRQWIFLHDVIRHRDGKQDLAVGQITGMSASSQQARMSACARRVSQHIASHIRAFACLSSSAKADDPVNEASDSHECRCEYWMPREPVIGRASADPLRA